MVDIGRCCLHSYSGVHLQRSSEPDEHVFRARAVLTSPVTHCRNHDMWVSRDGEEDSRGPCIWHA